MKIKTFKVLANKPSAVVRALIDGLEDPPIRVDMAIYGRNMNGISLFRNFIQEFPNESPEISCGCAVATTVLHLLPNSKKTYASLYNEMDLSLFSLTLNSLRLGIVSALLHYYDVPENTIDIITHISSHQLLIPELTTDNYKEKVQDYEKLYNLLLEYDL